MRVTIVMGGSEFSIDVEPQETVLNIKQKIEHLLSIPVASQTLAIWGWELIDGLDMEDYPIINESTKIHLNINSMPALIEEHSKIQITVKFSARKTTFEVEKTETVRSLKEKIHIIDGTPIKRMALYFSGQEMDEEFRYLTNYGISDKAEIIVFLKSTARMIADPPTRRLSLAVQTSSTLLNAATIPLDISDSSTLTELRRLLVTNKILPPDDYIFIHKQRIMRENCSLRWHGVGNGDFLYVFKGTVGPGRF
ncbi:polyubiquitin [Coffea eugenioides]|uniref:polyubiquitin n=1 Tax=Coffea eugenioides TaxID=49369 RepID=UPI000F607264|nr:polyubiquitin [Coffea eugenioides]